MKIFINNQFQEADNYLLESLMPGMMDSPGVFETLKVYNKRIFTYNEHLDRMSRGLKIYGYSGKVKRKELLKIIYDLLSINNFDNARVRVSILIKGNRLYKNIVCVPIEERTRPTWDRGFNVKVFKEPKNRTRLSNVKSLEYKIFLNAYLEAVKEGYDEVIFLNSKNTIVEGSRTNIFCFQKGCLYTPPIASGCLNGITRQKILEIAKDLGINIKVGNISLKDLKASEEVFLTNSIIEIIPVTAIDDIILSDEKKCEKTLLFLSQYRKLVKNSLNC